MHFRKDAKVVTGKEKDAFAKFALWHDSRSMALVNKVTTARVNKVTTGTVSWRQLRPTTL